MPTSRTTSTPPAAIDDGVVALVLSGGGARGAFDAGVVEVLEEQGVDPSIVSGTSAGAITGAGLACGWPAARITGLWTSLQTHDVLRPRLDLHRLVRLGPLLRDPRRLLGIGRASTTQALLDAIGWTWLFHLGPLRALLVDELGGERLPLRDDVTLTLSALEVSTGRLVRFSNRPLPDPDRDGSQNVVVELTVDHVLASAAIPGLFQPASIDGEEYWDGGLVSNTPLTAAVAHDPDRVLVVGASPDEPNPTPPRSLGDVLTLALDHVLRRALLDDVDHARTVNALVDSDADSGHHKEVDVLTILPTTPMTGIGDLLDFEPAIARDLVEDGRRTTRRALDGWAA